MKLKMATLALIMTASIGMSAQAQLNDDHFAGGANITAGAKKGAGGTLVEILNGKSDVLNGSFSATFTQAVGAKTILVAQSGKQVTLSIPAGTTADGGGGAIASGAGAVPAKYRPAVDQYFLVVATSNAAKVAGRLVISAAGTMTFTSSAAGGNFTDDAAAGFDATAISYSVP